MATVHFARQMRHAKRTFAMQSTLARRGSGSPAKTTATNCTPPASPRLLPAREEPNCESAQIAIEADAVKLSARSGEPFQLDDAAGRTDHRRIDETTVVEHVDTAATEAVQRRTRLAHLVGVWSVRLADRPQL